MTIDIPVPTRTPHLRYPVPYRSAAARIRALTTRPAGPFRVQQTPTRHQ